MLAHLYHLHSTQLGSCVVSIDVCTANAYTISTLRFTCRSSLPVSTGCTSDASLSVCCTVYSITWLALIQASCSNLHKTARYTGNKLSMFILSVIFWRCFLRRDTSALSDPVIHYTSAFDLGVLKNCWYLFLLLTRWTKTFTQYRTW